MKEKGFTLVELMTAISIVGILAMISQGSWASVRDDEQVRQAAVVVHSHMQGARMKAQTTGFAQCVGIDLVNGKVTESVWRNDSATSCTVAGGVITVLPTVVSWEDLQGVKLVNSNRNGSLAANQPNIVWFGFSANGESTGNSVLVKAQSPTLKEGIVVKANRITSYITESSCAQASMACVL